MIKYLCSSAVKNNKFVNEIYKWIIFGSISFSFILLNGCSQDSNKLSIVIEDGRIVTNVCVPYDSTVEKALEVAEIYIGENDLVSPSMDCILNNNDIIRIHKEYNINITIDNSDIMQVKTMENNVAGLLKSVGIELDSDDYINCSESSYLIDGMTLRIVNRITVQLSVDGEKKSVVTPSNTVEELLDEQNIQLSKDDRINKNVNDILNDGDSLIIERVNIQRIVENERISYSTKIEYSDALEIGYSEVKTEGKEGEKKVTYEVTYVDGKEVSRTKVDESIIIEPIEEIVVEGTKQGKYIINISRTYDCDGSGHGFDTITYSDGTVEYVDF